LALDYLPKKGIILDIGCGPGKLFQEMEDRGLAADLSYFGCDLSEAMLEASRIPIAQRWVGTVFSAPESIPVFDGVVLLGVTSYMQLEEWKETLDWIYRQLRPGGTLIVTFTHRSSLDFRIRRWLRRMLPARWIPGTLAGQSFPTYAYPEKEVRSMFSNWNLQKVIWTNHGVTPFNRIFPRFTLRWAEFCASQRDYRAAWLPLFSGDLLCVVKKPFV
ncbi:MAG: class I SAM-dependent methyltransferase, partial [Bacteroidota bacterium]